MNTALDAKNGRMACGGFTLIELVMALSIAAVAALFFTGFLAPQMKLYLRGGQAVEGKEMCGRVYMLLEERLRYGYGFYVDADEPGTLHYMVNRKAGSGENAPEACAVDITDLGELGNAALKPELVFTDCGGGEAVVNIRVLDGEGRTVYEREAAFLSIYGQRGDGVEAH